MKIEILNYTKYLSHNCVLSDINLTLESGKIYGFTGKNGSGKTMLMRAVCGLIMPSSGEVRIDGKTLGKDISFPESVGVLIENPGFTPNCSGFKNLKFLAQIQNRIGDEDIRSTLEKVGLDPDDKKSFRKYSLGMKQKLGIAAAIMENPKLLILDEPFNALDEETSDKIRSIILSYRSKDHIIILSCHDKEKIETLCDVIVEIQEGSVLTTTNIVRDDDNG
jgi:ABC-2 type transport system ATP-binding protein